MTAPWSAPRLWPDEECWIIGGGPSVPRLFGVPEVTVKAVMNDKQSPLVYSQYLLALHARHVIGVNNAYMLGDWVDVAFFGDWHWYVAHREALAQRAQLKVSCALRFGEVPYEGVKFLSKDMNSGISEDPTKVCWNFNSGAAAISLARHLGVKRVLLLGFDMTLDTMGVSHWHGRHRFMDTDGDGNRRQLSRVHAFDRHLKNFQAVANDALRLGLEILNVNPDSRIAEFPKVALQDVL